MLKPKVTLGNYWLEAFCCCFFEHEGFAALSLPSGGVFPLESCDFVWKTGWSASHFMNNSWHSSFGIPILYPLNHLPCLTPSPQAYSNHKAEPVKATTGVYPSKPIGAAYLRISE